MICDEEKQHIVSFTKLESENVWLFLLEKKKCLDFDQLIVLLSNTNRLYLRSNSMENVEQMQFWTEH